jgi:ATP-dependent DNA ligase
MERPKRTGIMLAYPGDDGRISRLGDRVFAQPKYKGERCRVEWFGGGPVLLSSYGNEFTQLPHINAALMQFVEDKTPFDGELYDHGRSFDGPDGIHSICSRRENIHPEYKAMKFYIFDIQWEDKSQWARIHYLNNLKDIGCFRGTPLVMSETSVIYSDDWLPYMTEYVQEGYEGIILRSPIALYRPKRDVGLIKIKPTEIDEYRIVEAYEAISQEGVSKGMVGGFTVMDREGIVFNVGAGKMTHKKREQLWRSRGDLPGKMLEVKHEPTKTKGGVPECAVAVRIKN